VSSLELPSPAAAADATELDLFVALSAALTGIDQKKLAPDVDQVQVKNDYFVQVKTDPAFPVLMQMMRADLSNPAVVAQKVMDDPKTQFLGRSIILMWYLGAWYPPKTLAQTPPPWPVKPEKVVSAKAYTQGWTWRVAQAHPMGYSELRFGYWSDVPPPLSDIIKATS
jgi:hypothetical protein